MDTDIKDKLDNSLRFGSPLDHNTNDVKVFKPVNGELVYQKTLKYRPTSIDESNFSIGAMSYLDTGIHFFCESCGDGSIRKTRAKKTCARCALEKRRSDARKRWHKNNPKPKAIA